MFIYNTIKIIDYFGLDRTKFGRMLVLLHALVAMLIILVIIFTKNLSILYLMIIFMIIQTFSYIKYHGCIITKLELKLTNDNYTVLDPMLDLIGVSKNNKTRYNMTLIILSIVWIILILKFYNLA